MADLGPVTEFVETPGSLNDIGSVSMMDHSRLLDVKETEKLRPFYSLSGNDEQIIGDSCKSRGRMFYQQWKSKGIFGRMNHEVERVFIHLVASKLRPQQVTLPMSLMSQESSPSKTVWRSIPLLTPRLETTFAVLQIVT